MSKKIIFGLGFTALMALASAACAPKGNSSQSGGGSSGSTELFKVVYYPGGYGEEYLEKFVKGYLAEQKGTTPEQIQKNVDYTLIADADVTWSADNYVKQDSKAPDLIIANRLSPTHITEGYIEPLDSVYDSKVTTSKGEQKVSDYLMPQGYQNYIRTQVYGTGDEHYYGMPWSAIPISIAYNETLMKQIPHVDASGSVKSSLLEGGKWALPPDTVSALKVYMNDIGAYNTAQGKNIIKFGWAGSSANWFESTLITWWAQHQGTNVSKVTGQGAFADFWNFPSEEIYKQEGLQVALETLKSLLIKDGEFVNSFQNPQSKEMREAQTDFANGEVAMALTGDFFEKEYKSQIAASGNVYKLMRVPSLDEYSDSKVLGYADFASVAYVPFKAKHKELSKGFLKYCCQEQQIVDYVKMTGGLKPVKCDIRELAKGYTFTAYQQSVLDLYYNSDKILAKYPENAEEISPLFTYEDGLKNCIFYSVSYPEVLSELKSLTAEQVMVSGAQNVDSVYKLAAKDFVKFRRDYDL